MKTLLSIGAFLVLAFVAASILFPSHPVSVVQAQADVVQPRSSAHTYSVVGKPTINIAGIEAVLKAAHSPALPSASAMHDLGVKYGIDPIYALAFFQHESSFGTAGQARANLGIGNIRCTQGYACINGYRAYSSWVAGIEDWYKLIYWYAHTLHLVTVEQIIPVYAPSADHNNPTVYINDVEYSVTVWR